MVFKKRTPPKLSEAATKNFKNRADEISKARQEKIRLIKKTK